MSGLLISKSNQVFKPLFEKVDNGDGVLSNGEAARAIRENSRDNPQLTDALITYLDRPQYDYDMERLGKVASRAVTRSRARMERYSRIPLARSAGIDPLRVAVVAQQIRGEIRQRKTVQKKATEATLENRRLRETVRRGDVGEMKKAGAK